MDGRRITALLGVAIATLWGAQIVGILVLPAAPFVSISLGCLAAALVAGRSRRRAVVAMGCIVLALPTLTGGPWIVAAVASGCVAGFVLGRRPGVRRTEAALVAAAAAAGGTAAVAVAWQAYGSAQVLMAAGLLTLCGIGLALTSTRAPSPQPDAAPRRPGGRWIAGVPAVTLAGWGSVLAGAVILAIAVGARDSRSCAPGRVCIWGPGIVPSAGISLRAPADCAVREAGFLELPRVVTSESLARWEEDPGYWTLADCFEVTVQELAGGTRSTGDDLERLARNRAARVDGGRLTVRRLDLATGAAVRADYAVSGTAFILPVGGYCIDHWLSADGAPVLLEYCSIGESFHVYEADPPWLAPTLASLQGG